MGAPEAPPGLQGVVHWRLSTVLPRHGTDSHLQSTPIRRLNNLVTYAGFAVGLGWKPGNRSTIFTIFTQGSRRATITVRQPPAVSHIGARPPQTIQTCSAVKGLGGGTSVHVNEGLDNYV